jgi:hypothetical protein
VAGEVLAGGKRARAKGARGQCDNVFRLHWFPLSG